MSTTPDLHGPIDAELDSYADDGFGEALPIRPKRAFLTKWSAGLMAVAVTAIGFYGGVELEKSKTTSGSSSALASAGTGTKAAGALRTSRTSGTGRAGAGGAPSGFGGAAASGTSGTVSSVDGKTIYVKDSAGDTVKAKLSSSTTITKSEKVGNGKVYPGDSVVITGSTGKNGEVTATAVTDSGASASSSTTSSTS